jgi:hypothetical protein
MPRRARRVPFWVEQEVLPRTLGRVEAVQVLHDGPVHRSAVVFTDTSTYVAEYGPLLGSKVFEVYYPETHKGQVLDCPHCGRPLSGAWARVGVGPAGDRAGDVDQVAQIPGIDAGAVRALRRRGLRTTHDLLAAAPEDVASWLGRTRYEVDRWYDLADLMRVRGVGRDFAELLLALDVNSARELAQENPDVLLQRLNDLQAGGEARTSRGWLYRDKIEAWIEDAGSLRDLRAPPARETYKGQGRRLRRGAPRDRALAPGARPRSPGRVRHVAGATVAASARRGRRGT